MSSCYLRAYKKQKMNKIMKNKKGRDKIIIEKDILV